MRTTNENMEKNLSQQLLQWSGMQEMSSLTWFIPLILLVWILVSKDFRQNIVNRLSKNKQNH